jgi:hypothetical protein
MSDELSQDLIVSVHTERSLLAPPAPGPPRDPARRPTTIESQSQSGRDDSSSSDNGEDDDDDDAAREDSHGSDSGDAAAAAREDAPSRRARRRKTGSARANVHYTQLHDGMHSCAVCKTTSTSISGIGNHFNSPKHKDAVTAVPPKHKGAGKTLPPKHKGAGKTLPPKHKKRVLEVEEPPSPPHEPAPAREPLTGFAEARVVGDIALIDTEIARGNAALIESREAGLQYTQSADNIERALVEQRADLAGEQAALVLAEAAEALAEAAAVVAQAEFHRASTERIAVSLRVVHKDTVVVATEHQHRDLATALRDADTNTAALAVKIAALGTRRDEKRAELSGLVGEARVGALLDEGAVAAMGKRMRELAAPFESAGVLTPAPPADIWGVGAALETLNDPCYVCTKTLVLALNPIEFACGHITCAACAKQLVQRGNVCGMCRVPIDARQAKYVAPRPVFDLSQ